MWLLQPGTYLKLGLVYKPPSGPCKGGTLRKGMAARPFCQNVSRIWNNEEYGTRIMKNMEPMMPHVLIFHKKAEVCTFVWNLGISKYWFSFL